METCDRQVLSIRLPRRLAVKIIVRQFGILGFFPINLAIKFGIWYWSLKLHFSSSRRILPFSAISKLGLLPLFQFYFRSQNSTVIPGLVIWAFQGHLWAFSCYFAHFRSGFDRLFWLFATRFLLEILLVAGSEIWHYQGRVATKFVSFGSSEKQRCHCHCTGTVDFTPLVQCVARAWRVKLKTLIIAGKLIADLSSNFH